MNIPEVGAKELLAMMDAEFESGHPCALVVTGHSMRPLLRNLKDQVILVSPEQRKPEQGEIVLFVRDGGACVLHRIIGVRRDGSFLINGDAQLWTEVIRCDQVRAVVSAVKRGKRYISCDGKLYRRYVKFWTGAMFLRRIVFTADLFAYKIRIKAGLRKKNHV